MEIRRNYFENYFLVDFIYQVAYPFNPFMTEAVIM